MTEPMKSRPLKLEKLAVNLETLANLTSGEAEMAWGGKKKAKPKPLAIRAALFLRVHGRSHFRRLFTARNTAARHTATPRVGPEPPSPLFRPVAICASTAYSWAALRRLQMRNSLGRHAASTLLSGVLPELQIGHSSCQRSR
jgi:hypothetical protein